MNEARRIEASRITQTYEARGKLVANSSTGGVTWRHGCPWMLQADGQGQTKSRSHDRRLRPHAKTEYSPELVRGSRARMLQETGCSAERFPNLKSVPGRQKLVEAVSVWGLGTGSLRAMDKVKHDARSSGLFGTWRLGSA